MALSGIGLLDDLAGHLAGDAALAALVKGGLFHARTDGQAECPFVLYAMPRLDYETGFGPQDASGQTAEAVVMLTGVDESSGDTSTLTDIAARLDELVRTWAPVGWAVRNVNLATERLDAFDRAGRTYQSASMQYAVTLERA